jgi:hypothetical protein
MEESKKKTFGYLTRILYKFYLKLKDKFDTGPKITDEEKYCIEICNKLLTLPTSKLTYAPISDKRYLVNDEKSMYVIIANHTMNITNHVYSYSIYVQETSSYAKIIKKFDSILEINRIKIEEEIQQNIKHSLQTILNSLD